MPDARKLLERFARAERGLRDTEFVAPVLPGSAVAVRVSGLVQKFSVVPSGHRGWSVLRANGDGTAAVVRPASLSELSKYMTKLPRYRLLLVERDGERWLGLRATGDARLASDVLYPVGLVDEGERFDAVCARFDGGSFWFEGPDPGADPARAAWLRDQRELETTVEQLARPGLTPEEVAVYAHLIAEEERAEREAAERVERSAERRLEHERDREERRVERAVGHAGGRLLRMDPTGDQLDVTFEVDGRRRTALVRRRDLAVVAAGICLSGMDADFDLASLVTVLRESAGG